MNKKPICISLEGLDCSGKSHLARTLQDYFYKLGYKIKTFKDFTDNKVNNKSFANEIRNFLLYDSEYDELPSTATPFLITAIRLKMIEDVHHFINSNKKDENPVIVLLDRYVHSTLAYDYDSQLGVNELQNLCRYACTLLKPDLSILLDIDKETYDKRITTRGNKDKIELTLDTRFEIIKARFLNVFHEEDYKLAGKYVILNNNEFDNEQKCKDLISGLLLSREFDKEFDVRV